MPYQIGVVERDQWMACLRQAMDELAVPEPLCRNLSFSFAKTADFMRDQEE